ncbi:hypothetical protein CH63R_11130 [Colletotrichum higginsianum IMI 349063]|uniref:Uncharacterized protein n=1 Tax=Colletotrichum higginsianum (strain IMI 349063) TaxID=759273 RepID=A0A1B7XXC5_COLHI|nr:hypothetical protein CH63R_11130 [Colletotrichum higginsianum IMI 349063]OBR04427.1 hypothetical protein CH63R_11130 [Colletotrichum higginsianum IMI 349063]
MKFTTILSVGMLLLGVAEAQVCYRCFYTRNIGCGACNDKTTKYDGEGGDTYWVTSALEVVLPETANWCTAVAPPALFLAAAASAPVLQWDPTARSSMPSTAGAPRARYWQVGISRRAGPAPDDTSFPRNRSLGHMQTVEPSAGVPLSGGGRTRRRRRRWRLVVGDVVDWEAVRQSQADDLAGGVVVSRPDSGAQAHVGDEVAVVEDGVGGGEAEALVRQGAGDDKAETLGLRTMGVAALASCT